jgi:hypothetical protein
MWRILDMGAAMLVLLMHYSESCIQKFSGVGHMRSWTFLS